MRLAATLTTVREDWTAFDGTDDAAPGRAGDRQPVTLRGTLRGGDAAPRDVVILDISTSGFLAELPVGTALANGTRVRIATSPIGAQEAVVVRQDERCHGFAFAHPLDERLLDGIDRDQPSSVTSFPGGAALPHPEPDLGERISARASLAIMVAISLGLWLALAAVVAVLTVLA